MLTNYFPGIYTMSELKILYRRLVLENHPDLGGDTDTMKVINLQFEKAYDTLSSGTVFGSTGYESDYAGASARQYESHVWDEYRWKGERYNGQSNAEIIVIIRNWIKQTYPAYKFSVRREGYQSFNVTWLEADFNPFSVPGLVHLQFNHYWPEDGKLNERAVEVMRNIAAFVTSYRYDNSNSQVDYFDTNFYINMSVGDYRNPFMVTATKIAGRGKRIKKTEAEKALGNEVFGLYKNKIFDHHALGRISYSDTGEQHFWPNYYASWRTAKKRILKLRSAGIPCRYEGTMIVSA